MSGYRNWSHATAFAVAFSAAGAATMLTALVGAMLGVPISGLLEFSAVFTSYGCTLLFVLERRQAYYWGLVTTLLYAELFRQFGLPASAAVQIYLLGALLYGWWRWGPDDTRPVTKVRPVWVWSLYLLFTAATWTGAMLLSSALGSPVPRADAAILAATILAQWLLDNKKVETWVVWIGVNLLAVPLYWSQGLHLVSFQYVIFLLNAFWGLYVWRLSMISDTEFENWLNEGPEWRAKMKEMELRSRGE